MKNQRVSVRAARTAAAAILVVVMIGPAACVFIITRSMIDSYGFETICEGSS